MHPTGLEPVLHIFLNFQYLSHILLKHSSDAGLNILCSGIKSHFELLKTTSFDISFEQMQNEMQNENLDYTHPFFLTQARLYHKGFKKDNCNKQLSFLQRQKSFTN